VIEPQKAAAPSQPRAQGVERLHKPGPDSTNLFRVRIRRPSMLYDPKVLRAVLKAVTDKPNGGLELGEILERTEAHLKEHQRPVPDRWPHVTTLARFMKAEGSYASRRNAELHAIWCYLESVDQYKKFFQPNRENPELSPPEDAFLVGMTRLFSESTDLPILYDLHGRARLGQRIAGTYACYRPSWRAFSVNHGHFTTQIAVTLIEISPTNLGHSISETQDYPPVGSRASYHQYDRGCLASLGKYIYFLMKEEGGTSVKFGVIQNLVSDAAGRPIDWLSGLMYSSSSVSFYPPARFFCRRVSDSKALTLGDIEFDELTDQDAKDYLRESLR